MSSSSSEPETTAAVAGHELCASGRLGFFHYYRLGPVIETGAYSTVRRCSHRLTHRSFAVKIVKCAGNSPAAARETPARGPQRRSSTRERPPPRRQRRAGRSISCTISQVVHELQVYNLLDGCPGILKLHDKFVKVTDPVAGTGVVYAVFEVAEGGKLFDAVCERGSLCEEDARGVMRSLFQTCAAIHRRGIVHCDIKLQNVVVSHPHVFDSGVKLEDMGLAAIVGCRGLRSSSSTASFDGSAAAATYSYAAGDDDCEVHTAMCGTPTYMAPEVCRLGLLGHFPTQKRSSSMSTRSSVVDGSERHSGQPAHFDLGEGYGPAVDVWSLGVSLYIMLSGQPPSERPTVDEQMQRTCAAEVSYDDPAWAMVSNDAQHLLRRCLTKDPTARITAEDALNHPWLRQN